MKSIAIITEWKASNDSNSLFTWSLCFQIKYYFRVPFFWFILSFLECIEIQSLSIWSADVWVSNVFIMLYWEPIMNERKTPIDPMHSTIDCWSGKHLLPIIGSCLGEREVKWTLLLWIIVFYALLKTLYSQYLGTIKTLIWNICPIPKWFFSQYLFVCYLNALSHLQLN